MTLQMVRECKTPSICRATVSRFELDDFDLTDRELEELRDRRVLAQLDDIVREVADFPTVAAEALERWRAKR